MYVYIQTGKSATVRRTAVREACVSRTNEAPLQYHGTITSRGSRGARNGAPLRPKGVSQCTANAHPSRHTVRPIIYYTVRPVFVQRFSSNPIKLSQDWTKTGWTKMNWTRSRSIILHAPNGKTCNYNPNGYFLENEDQTYFASEVFPLINRKQQTYQCWLDTH